MINSQKNQVEGEQNNDFLQNNKQSLSKTNLLSHKVKDQKLKNSKQQLISAKEELITAKEEHANYQQTKSQNKHKDKQMEFKNDHLSDAEIGQQQEIEQHGENLDKQLRKNVQQMQDQQLHDSVQRQNFSKMPKQQQIKSLLHKLRHELKVLQSNQNQQFKTLDQSRFNELKQNIEILQIKLRLTEKMQKRKQQISFERINHLELIFNYYCAHIFKTGKHMTFDRLQYQKNHLTIDRLCVLLKDFGLTTLKSKDGKLRLIIEKQQIIKLFKKISPNCKDLDFQQFIIIIEKFSELYFDLKITYDQRKQMQKKEKLKIKQNLQKKQKYKEEMMKRHQQKLEKLENSIGHLNSEETQKEDTKGAQNDQLVQQMMSQDPERISKKEQQENSNKQQNQNQFKKSVSLKSRNFQKQDGIQFFKKSNNPLLSLTKQQKIEYFYELINVDDVQSFSKKMRELNLPIFKTYKTQFEKPKEGQNELYQDKKLNSRDPNNQCSTEDEKRLKQLRQKINERNQKLKHSSVSSLTKEQYQLRKLKRSRLQQEDLLGRKERKPKKIDLTQAEINLSSLSKLAYENVNFSKFNPKNFYKKEDDDDLFLKQYGQSPVRTRKQSTKGAQLSKIIQNPKNSIQEKDKISETFLLKLKKRQSEVEINQIRQQVSQMYRFNDRTQRQKRLIDRFLQKNK